MVSFLRLKAKSFFYCEFNKIPTFARMEIFHHTLSNGIRLVHKPVKSMVAHFGFIVHTGSRDELQDEHGMAHFIEHVIFKGTKKRKAYHILSRLEDVGGELNAYTTKEDTCIYASFLQADYERAIELIYDICFNSTFPQKELNKEKSIIIDEILSYKDSPSELIFDEFEEQIFNKHSLGRSILGNEKRLLSFSREEVLKFIQHNYASNEIVLSSVGSLDFRKFIYYCEKYFGQVSYKSRIRKRIIPDSYQPQVINSRKNTHQTHCMIGNLAYNALSPKRVPLALLNNILGGPGMNSRLNMSLREKSAYSYNVESNYTTYSDTGFISVYFGSEKDNFEKSLKLVYREFDILKMQQMGTMQLSKAKKQLIGQLAIASDSNEHFMLTMGKSVLLYDRVDSLEEMAVKINAITSSDILSVANEVFNKNEISVLQYY
jgi:predicted Zn-dependent peptidase